jgi:hypothetical protein
MMLFSYCNWKDLGVDPITKRMKAKSKLLYPGTQSQKQDEEVVLL